MLPIAPATVALDASSQQLGRDAAQLLHTGRGLPVHAAAHAELGKRLALTQRRARLCRGLKHLIKESKEEQDRQVGVAFSPRTTSLTVLRPRGQKPAEERFFESLENEARAPLACNLFPLCMHVPENGRALPACHSPRFACMNLEPRAFSRMHAPLLAWHCALTPQPFPGMLMRGWCGVVCSPSCAGVQPCSWCRAM